MEAIKFLLNGCSTITLVHLRTAVALLHVVCGPGINTGACTCIVVVVVVRFPQEPASSGCSCLLQIRCSKRLAIGGVVLLLMVVLVLLLVTLLLLTADTGGAGGKEK